MAVRRRPAEQKRWMSEEKRIDAEEKERPRTEDETVASYRIQPEILVPIINFSINYLARITG
jgi:hypothetical protein